MCTEGIKEVSQAGQNLGPIDISTLPMAKDFKPKNPVRLFVKNNRTEVWGYESEFKGHLLYRIAEVYLDDRYGEAVWSPGKGLQVPLDKKEEFIANVKSEL